MLEKETTNHQPNPYDALASVLKVPILRESQKNLAEGRKLLADTRKVRIPLEDRILDGDEEAARSPQYIPSVSQSKDASKIIARGKVLQSVVTGKPVEIDVDDVEAKVILGVRDTLHSLGHARDDAWERARIIGPMLTDESKGEQIPNVDADLDYIGAPELKPKRASPQT